VRLTFPSRVRAHAIRDSLKLTSKLRKLEFSDKWKPSMKRLREVFANKFLELVMKTAAVMTALKKHQKNENTGGKRNRTHSLRDMVQSLKISP
jgi:hypothetical protein